MKGMGNSVQQYANKAEAGIARSERLYRKLTPALGEASKQFLSMAGTAAIVAATIGGIVFSYESVKKYEDALASFRTIVGGTDKEFAVYQKGLMDVAKATKTSSVETVIAAEKIAGLNADFAKTSDGLNAVTKSAITLSKASGDELGNSAESLVGIMNQFSLEANQAGRAINVLAAGQAVGASTITQSAEAYKNFGSVAASANISLEQSQALIQTVAKKSIFGAEAGTKLRGSVLKLQQAGVGYASGQFNINDALTEAKTKIDKLQTAKQKDAALTKMFGAENISTGLILLNNIDLYKKYTDGVTGTNAAQEQSAIKSNTLTNRLGELSAAWVNIITGSDKASTGLDTAKNAIQFVTNNLDAIVSIGTKVLLFFIAWKALLISSKVAMVAYNIVFGINNALQQRSLFYTEGNIYAKYADLTVTKLLTANQWLLNAAMAANPIGLFIVAIVALVAIIVVAIKYYNEWGAALLMVLGPLGWVINLIQSFRRNWDMITEAFKTGGVLEGFKAIGKTILDAVLMPLEQVMKIIASVTGADWASQAAKDMEKFRSDLGVNVTTDESGQSLEKKPALLSSAQQAIQKMESTNNAKVSIDVKDPNKRTNVSSDNNFVQIKTSSTMGWGQ